MKKPLNHQAAGEASPLEPNDAAMGSESVSGEPVEAEDDELASPVRDLIRRVRSFSREPADPRLDKGDAHQQFLFDTAPADGNTAGGVADAQSDVVDQYDTQATDPNRGSRLGRFEIRKTLGSGGFGIVMLAYDPQLDRQVALKVPRLDSLMSADGRGRFLREARAAALLSHPNIVPVFEAGQIGPVLFIAFEFVDGMPLNQWIQEHGSNPDAQSLAGLMLSLASAVQHAHSRGIVHRDLKPANVLLASGKSVSTGDFATLADRARISDFGMAKIVQGDGLTTQTGSMVGTPAYMAPEQIRQSKNTSGAAIDVYGLGAILYELLAGRPPFAGESVAAVLRSVERDEPVAPRRIRPEVSKDLEAICLKCLSKNPAQRYSSAGELELDLERFLDGKPIRARTATRLERAGRWIARNRAISIASAIAFLSLAVGLGFSISQARRAERNFAESELHKSRAERHRDRSQTTIDEMLNEVVDMLEPFPRMSEFRTSLLQKALVHETEMAREESDDPASQIRAAAAFGRIGQIEFRLGNPENARRALDDSESLLANVETDDPEVRIQLDVCRLTTQCMICKILLARNQFEEANQRLQPLAAELDNIGLSESDSRILRAGATTYGMMGRTNFRLSNHAAAIAAYNKVKDFYSRIPDDVLTPADRTDMATTSGAIATVLHTSGKTAEALDLQKQTIAELKALLLLYPERTAIASNLAITGANLVSACLRSGQYGIARECLPAVEEVATQLVDDFPEVLRYQEILSTLLSNKAAVLQQLKEYDEAIVVIQQLITTSESIEDRFGVVPSVVESVSRACGNLGNIQFYQKQDPDLARQAFSKQLAMANQLVDAFPAVAGYRSTATIAWTNLAKMHSNLLEWGPAETAMRSAMAENLVAMQLAPDNVFHQQDDSTIRAELARILCAARKHDEAFAAIDGIVTIDPENCEQIMTAATGLAMTFPMLDSFAPKIEAVDAETRDRYQAKMLALLELAVGQEYRDSSKVTHLGQLVGLEDDETFLAILDRIE